MTHRAPSLLLPIALFAFAPRAGADCFEDAGALSKAGKPDEAAAAYEACASEPGARAADALVEAAFVHFRQGRARQRLHRNPPDAVASFERARELFRRAADSHPDSPAADRARYMAGSASLFLWDLAAAERDYGRVVEEMGPAVDYYGKALVRQGRVRLHQLRTEEGLSLLRRFRAETPDARDSLAKEADTLLRYGQLFGRDAPELDVASWPSGPPVKLKDLRGRVVALYFFTTWCPNCRKEIGFMKDLHRRFAERGLELVAMTDTSKGQTHESVRAYVEQHGIAYRVAIDAGGTFPTYEGRLIPNVVLIDKRGRVRWHDHPGALPDSTIEQLLAEPG